GVAFLVGFSQLYFIKASSLKQKATASKPLLFVCRGTGFVPDSSIEAHILVLSFSYKNVALPFAFLSPLYHGSL
ncbi:hypothetical protein, partial [Streptococcus criceti]